MTTSRPARVWAEVTGGDALGRGHQPALSWWLPEGSSVQRACQVRTDDGFDTGRVDAATQSFVRVPVFDRSRRFAQAQVRVWTSFEVAPFGRSRLYVTALGLYEAFIDGQRVGDAELTPGYTQYRERVQYQAFDVGPLLRPGPGPHVLAVLLADGWYRGQVGLRGRRTSTARMWRCGRRSRWSRRTGRAGGWRRLPVRTGGPRRRTSRRLTLSAGSVRTGGGLTWPCTIRRSMTRGGARRCRVRPTWPWSGRSRRRCGGWRRSRRLRCGRCGAGMPSWRTSGRTSTGAPDRLVLVQRRPRQPAS